MGSHHTVANGVAKELMIRPEDYHRENLANRPSNSRVSKKVKLPTMEKTRPHKCSLCPRTDATRYPISEKEVRWMCPVCVQKFVRRNDKEKPNFVKGSQLG